MTILVTGAAGFIGFHLCRALLDRGDSVIGIDDLNEYYDVRLKLARVAQLESHPGFTFQRIDIADRLGMAALAEARPDITRIVNLAAQAGVRYSLLNPYAYSHSNLEGQLVILETARRLKRCEHLVYASSSSVYGGNTKLPLSVADRVDNPVSLYAATKRAGELMAHCYSHLFHVPMTGLRFFTVYGPWGRPDMAAWLFVEAILADRPIPVFNSGAMRRDFTFIDDIVAGVMAALDRPPTGDDDDDGGSNKPPHRVYNLGNHRSEPLMRFIHLVEVAVGRPAKLEFQPMQPGDVRETFADIEASRRDLGFEPRTTIDEGIPRFVAWYRHYHGL